MYVHMYICMRICTFVCTYVRMYVLQNIFPSTLCRTAAGRTIAVEKSELLPGNLRRLRPRGVGLNPKP